GGVAAHLNVVLKLFLGDQVGLLGAVNWSNLVDFAGYFDRFSGAPYRELGVDIALLAARQADSGDFESDEALGLDGKIVAARRHRGEREVSVAIGDRVALRTGLRILKCDFRLRNDGGRLIGYYACQ